MSKKVLIISPYFPPVNAADMHRVRTSLPYFQSFGWDAEVVVVDNRYSDMPQDLLLLETVPPNIKIHKVKAFNKKWTSKIGLGSIALRSLWFYRRKVDELLKSNRYALIYFSTTQFPVCILGARWEKKFNIPYAIDMQDPWHSEYYQDKPMSQRPPKYWFSYCLNKWLEPLAINSVSGLISVSKNYIEDLKTRYPKIKNIPSATVTFGAFADDIQIAEAHQHEFIPLLDPAHINLVYVGRGGLDLYPAISQLFKVLKAGLNNDPELYKRLKVYFIGTSYAPAGKGIPTIMPLAKQLGVEESVREMTDRVAYYHALTALSQADGLFIPGSDDAKYTASKIYPYLMTKKPLLAIFNKDSSSVSILKEFGISTVYNYQDDSQMNIRNFLNALLRSKMQSQQFNEDAVAKHSALNKTKLQCALFDEVVRPKNSTLPTQP